MKNRVIVGAAALAVVVALVIVAVVAGGGGDSKEPKALPIGAGGAGTARDAALAMPIEGGGAYGGIEYKVGKLPDLPGEADAFELAAVVADVNRIADVLGVARKDVHAEKMGGGPWSVYLDQAVSSSSGVGYACPAATDDVTTTTCAPPPDYEEPKRPEGMPTKDEARDIATKLFGKLGIELDGATVRVEDGFSQWMVSVDPKLDGQKVVGMTSTIGIGPDGKVVSANGWWGDAKRGDTYPLITPEEAAKRLQENQPRIMAGTAGGAKDMLIAPAPDCQDCPPPEPTIVTITGASLGLQLYGGYEPSGPAYLVPTYIFTTDQPDTGELWQIAIEDKYLAPPPTVPEKPGQTEPGGSGGAPTPDDPNQTTVTAVAGGSSSAGSSCNSSDADGVYVQVCAPSTAKAGENIEFQLTAKGRIRDDCGSPVPDYGDGEGVATCMIACESYPEQPTGIDRTYEHSYAKPGTYTAKFTLMGCGSDGPQASVSLEVRIE